MMRQQLPLSNKIETLDLIFLVRVICSKSTLVLRKKKITKS